MLCYSLYMTLTFKMILNCTSFERNVMRVEAVPETCYYTSCVVRFGMLCEQNGSLCERKVRIRDAVARFRVCTFFDVSLLMTN